MSRSYHFPFIVTSNGVGTFTFKNFSDSAEFVDINGNSAISRLTVRYFLDENAKKNPDNIPEKDYYISRGLGKLPIPKWHFEKIGNLSYAEEVSRNMFGRDESRGLHTGGFVSRSALAESRKAIDSITRGSTVAGILDLDGIIMSMANPFRVHAQRDEVGKLKEEVNRLNGELAAAHATIAKVREALRTQAGEDVQAHAKVLRQMADALVKLWHGEK